MKILSKRYAGHQQVYDIGVPKAHNFFLDNGVLASNCFNKCLDGNTLVLVEDKQVSLKSIQSGDLISVFISEGVVFAPVVELIDTGIQEVYAFEMDDGTVVKATPDHRFLCEDQRLHTLKEVLISKLSIIKYTKGIVRIKNIRSLGMQQTYNLHVDHPEHNYILANGLVSANSHSIAYSFITYQCAWLKANYPIEFFAGLMSIRSQSMAPQDWALKAPEYISEARQMGIAVHGPLINQSSFNFRIVGKEIYFGINAIKGIGKTVARSIIQTRGDKPFTSIEDFIGRINTSKVTTKSFECLIQAGAFDKLGYNRQDLINSIEILYSKVKIQQIYYEKIAENRQRAIANALLTPKIEKRKELQRIHKLKRERDLTESELQYIEDTRALRELKPLKVPEIEVIEAIQRYSKIALSISEIKTQAAYIGCYTTAHPARILHPRLDPLSQAEVGSTNTFAVELIRKKVIKDRKGNLMAFVTIGDGTALCEGVIFSSTYSKLISGKMILKEGDIIKVTGKVQETDPQPKMIIFKIQS